MSSPRPSHPPSASGSVSHRWRPLATAALPVAITAGLYGYNGSRWALGLLLLATALFLLAVGAPRIHAPIQRALEAFGRACAVAVTYLLLLLVFVFVMVPGRLVLLLRRRDPLDRAHRAAVRSYWQPVVPVADARNPFERQF